MSEKLPDRDLKILAGLGLLFALAVGLFLVFGSIYVTREMARMAACEQRSEQDPGCQPGFLWPALESAKQEMLKELDQNL